MTVLPYAITDRGDHAILVDRGESSIWTAEQSAYPGGLRRTVPACTIDAAVQWLTPPDMIKIDIEGAELAAFAGGITYLTSRKPIVIVEFLSDEQMACARAMLPMYEFTQLDQTNWLLR